MESSPHTPYKVQKKIDFAHIYKSIMANKLLSTDSERFLRQISA